MSNLLRPAGLVPRASWSTTRSIVDLPVRERDPMPAHAGTWISDGGRARRLLKEELAKGLGVPQSWGDLELLDPRPLGWQTCSHIYEWLGNVLATADASTDDDNATAAPDWLICSTLGLMVRTLSTRVISAMSRSLNAILVLRF
jgi:hypothetical protein